jgi:hypothetical protein
MEGTGGMGGVSGVRGPARLGLLAVLVCCAVAACAALGASTARATEDTEPPVLESLSISPATIDTTSEARTVIVKAHISDAAGLQYPNVDFFSSTGRQSEDGEFVLVSGTNEDGEYEARVPFYRYSQAGTWKIELRLPDRAGNSSVLDAAEVEAKGFPATLDVEDEDADTEPPVLESLSISPSSLSGGAAIRTVTVKAHIVASQSPVRFPNVEFLSPTGKQGENEELERISGTDTNGEYEAKVPFPAYAEEGTWKIAIRLGDYVGNVAELTASRLEGEGFPTTVEVQSLVEDTEPPVLTALSISPASVDVASSEQSVLVKAHITDNLSGVRYANVKFFSPAGVQGENPDFELVSGSDTNGEYEAEVPFSQYAEAGTWRIDVRLTDYAGNVAELEAPTLEEDGYPTTVLVENAPPELGPDLKRLGGGSSGVLKSAIVSPPAGPAPALTAPFAGASVVGAAPVPSTAGTVSLHLSCQASSTCAGSVTLSVLLPAPGGRRSRHHAQEITLAAGSFDLSGAGGGSVRLRLTSEARKLLARYGVLHAKVTIVARDGEDVSHTSTSSVTLHRVRRRAAGHA